MTSWLRTESSTPADSAQYLGRTPEEALARARTALGPDTELRCWKTRRGGVAGFFTTELYVASLTPPPGAERGRSPSRAKPKGTPAERSGERSVSDEAE